MATGYEARQGGLDTFAIGASAPVQTETGASGQSRAAQNVGGESIGGAVGGHYSAPGAVAEGLGKFFGEFIEPAIQRKEQEQFFKGYTEAQSGRALGELTDNGSPLTKIFGPSGFAKGAQFFTAHAAIDKFAADALADRDELKRLSPAELSKHMAAASQSMMTGDPYADQQIQVGLLEAQGPVIQTIAKERYGWLQSEGVRTQSIAGHSAASLLQEVSKATARLGEGADTEAQSIQEQRFLGVMGQPEGMDDAVYQKGLTAFLKKASQEGNFNAVELLRSRGVTSVLTDEQAKAVDDTYDKYGKRFLDEAAATPEMSKLIGEIDYAIKTEKLSPGGVQEAMRGLNAKLRQATGIDQDYFDDTDLRAGSNGVIDAMISRQRREEARGYQIEDRAAAKQDVASEKEAAAALEVSGLQGAWGTGQIKSAEAGGMRTAGFNTIAMAEYNRGDLTGIARAFKTEGWSSAGVAAQVQSLARNGIGTKYTKDAQHAYGIWQKFMGVNPELAHEYFGKYDLAFSNFHQMVSGGLGAEGAYHAAFADAGQYSVQAIPADRRREFTTELTTLVAAQSFSWTSPTTWGNYTPTETTKGLLAEAIGSNFAVLAQHSGRPTPELAKQAYTQAVNNGTWEQYGTIGWGNTRPGQTLAGALGLKPKDAATAIPDLLLTNLRKVGVDTLEGAEVLRVGDGLWVTSLIDGETKHVTISGAYLKAYRDKYLDLQHNKPTKPIMGHR